MRPLLDRLLAWVVRLAVSGFFRSVEVAGRDRVPRDRPVLVVANHFNALMDGVLVVHVLGRVPRFLAKSTLWRSPLARPLLALAGLVPVTRRQDATDPGDNAAAFAATHRVLRRGGAVSIFPEGTVSVSPALGPLRTGAARIALGARAAGAAGLVVVPIGLLYEDRVALRSRALARVGRPIDLDRVLTGPAATRGPDDQAAVRDLTARIDAHLRDVVPPYRDEREAAVLGRAAEIALRADGRVPPAPVPLERRERLARRLAGASGELREQLLDALARYHLDLEILGLRDEHLAAEHRAWRLLRLVAATGARLALLAPFALAGAVVNAVPYWGVHWTGRLLPEPVMKATARLLAGFLLFPLAWLAAAWVTPWSGWLPGLVVFAASPVLGLVAVHALDRAVAVRRAWRGWAVLRDRSGRLAQVRADRERLCRLVEEARRAGGADGPGPTAARGATGGATAPPPAGRPRSGPVA